MDKQSFRRLALLAVFLSLTSPAGFAAAPGRTQRGERTALDRYVAKPDTNYSFHVAQSIKGEGYTTHYVDMISQAWLTTNEVNQPIWKHCRYCLGIPLTAEPALRYSSWLRELCPLQTYARMVRYSAVP